MSYYLTDTYILLELPQSLLYIDIVIIYTSGFHSRGHWKI